MTLDMSIRTDFIFTGWIPQVRKIASDILIMIWWNCLLNFCTLIGKLQFWYTKGVFVAGRTLRCLFCFCFYLPCVSTFVTVYASGVTYLHQRCCRRHEDCKYIGPYIHVTGRWFYRVLRFPPPRKLTAMI
jgi:hypothetical protein